MSNEHLRILGAVVVGLGATAMADLWSLIAARAFKVSPPNFCLVGRWIRLMQSGTFVHADITKTPAQSAECTTGWIAHYATGVAFALVFASVAPERWLDSPSPLPAVLFGIGTIAFPFLVMHPSFGLGIAASKSPRATQARLKSLMTHAAFGLGLYVAALPVSLVFRAS